MPDPENYGVAELPTTGACPGWWRSRPSPPPTWRWWASTCSPPAIFDAARAIEPSGRGELEITDAIQDLVDGGSRVDPHVVHGWWKDTGQVADMLEANRLILDDLEERLDGEIIDCQSRAAWWSRPAPSSSAPPSAARP